MKQLTSSVFIKPITHPASDSVQFQSYNHRYKQLSDARRPASLVGPSLPFLMTQRAVAIAASELLPPSRLRTMLVVGEASDSVKTKCLYKKNIRESVLNRPHRFYFIIFS